MRTCRSSDQIVQRHRTLNTRFSNHPSCPSHSNFVSYPLPGVGLIARGLNLHLTELRICLCDAHLRLVALRDREFNVLLDWDWGMRLGVAVSAILRFKPAAKEWVLGCVYPASS